MIEAKMESPVVLKKILDGAVQILTSRVPGPLHANTNPPTPRF